MKVSAIICAAGEGKRAGFGKNKLLAPLYGVPAILHTLRKFDIPEVDEVIVAASKKDFKDIEMLAMPFGYTVIQGGATRAESVKLALEHVTGDITIIHDGARPFVSHDLIVDCIESVKKHETGICALHFTDTVVTCEDDRITHRLHRDDVYTVQTPQGFLTEKIKKAYALAESDDKLTYTDDSTLYRMYIEAPRIIDGDPENVKLTYKCDYVREMPPIMPTHTEGDDLKIGIGIDVHAFVEGDHVTLCGVKIPCDGTLDAHSDGDVVLHAAMDALLSAAGLKDIGTYFPDTDDAYRDCDSGTLFRKALEAVKETGYAPVNFSITIQAEQPRLAPHIDTMRENLSKLSDISMKNIGIAAGTCEGLGFVGQGQGITAYCSVLIKKID